MRRSGFLLLACGVLPWIVHAADTERQQIAAERQAIADRFAVDERACLSRFAVTACVEEARSRRRNALAPLRERELTLDEAERRRRAEERRQAIAQRKQEVAGALAQASAPPEPQMRVRQPMLGTSAPLRPVKPVDDGASRAASAQRRMLDARQRQEEAKTTRERIERRQAEREAQGKKAQPLPTPISVSR